jgi:uncharacterized RDD family membrane protein YckC
VKCPTCGYIGFETSDRCRNCGYEFAQAAASAPAQELSLRDGDAGGPLREIAIRDGDEEPTPPSATRGPNIERVMQNLDRVLGEAPPDLPLFDGGPDAEPDLSPLVSTGAPPRRPLAVRRATPDPARLRPKPVRHQPIAQQPLELPLADTLPPAAAVRTRHEPMEAVGAPPLRRAIAALIDLTLLAAIDLIVVYFTLRMCGLSSAEVAMLPAVPLGAFFLLVNGGYLAAFTAAGGQTIGKMACGLKVVGHADQPVSGGLAIVRAAGCLASLASLGLGFIPALVGEGGRAIEDRLADTRVVRVSS